MSDQVVLQMIDELAGAIRLLADERPAAAKRLADHVEDAVNEVMNVGRPVTGHDTVWLMEHEG